MSLLRAFWHISFILIAITPVNAVEFEKGTENAEDSVIHQKRILMTQRIENVPVVDGRLIDECWNLG